MRALSKKCVQCGKSFTGNYTHGKEVWRKRKYCSLECKYEAAPKTASVLTKACEQCGRKFRNRRESGRTIEPYKWAKARFCSPQCRAASMVGKAPPNKGIKENLKTRLLRYVIKDKDTECWNWTGSKSAKGYGHLQVNGKKALAHRVSYMLRNGAIPQGEGFHGFCICHKCDNPSCVNPKHLFIGTQRANMHDRDLKGRNARLIGHQHGMSKLDERQAKAIKSLHGEFTQKELAKMFDVSVSTICNIINLKNWTHT